jgi:adenylate cyclase
MKKIFTLGRLTSLLILVLLVAARIWDPNAIEIFRNRSFDFFQTLQPRAQLENSPVVVVDLDEASLREFGQWPWPRTLIAQLIANLFNNGVVSAAFDVIFPEPDRMSPGSIADHLVLLDEATRAALRAQPSNDAILADVMKQTRVVVGRAAIPGEVGAPAASLPTTSIAELGGSPKPYVPTFGQLIANLPILEGAAKGHGIITLAPEPDGIVRRVPLIVAVKDRLYPTLSLEALRVATGQKSLVVRTNPAGVDRVIVSNVAIPTDRDGQVWIHYAPHDPAKFVSAGDVLAGRAPDARLRGKIALIGTSVAGLLDLKATPIEHAMPGVEIHAQLLDNIFGQNYLSRPNYALGMEVVAFVLLSLVIIVLVPMVGPGGTLAIGVVVNVLLAAAAWFAYSELNYLVDVTFPIAASTIIFAFLTFFNYVHEGMQKRQVRTAFSQYLSPALVEQLAAHPERLRLGGETREMTFLFSDLNNFTAIAETYGKEPAGLTRLVNRLLTPLSNAILDHDGTIDKYMGDCIMAFWNAPLDDAAHATHACEAALDMRRAMAELNVALRGESADPATFRPLRAGIGINTGTCVVGNMGSDLRFDYSVLGDSVNLASRLEQQTRNYGADIMLGENTVAQIDSDRFAVLEIDLIAVKGKSEAVRIYALIDSMDELDADDFKAMRERHDAFLAAYRDQDWDTAVRMLEACRQYSRWPHTLQEMFVERIDGYRAAPPGPGWSGVYIALTK